MVLSMRKTRLIGHCQKNLLKSQEIWENFYSAGWNFIILTFFLIDKITTKPYCSALLWEIYIFYFIYIEMHDYKHPRER